MLHKIMGDGLQARFRREQMYFLFKLMHHLFRLIRIQIRRLNGIQNLLRDLRILDFLDLFAPVLIIQRNGCLILHGPFEIINGDITAKGAGGNLIGGQERGARETDAGRRWQQLFQIVGKDAVLAAVIRVKT